MDEHVEEFINFWGQLDVINPPFVHPEDQPFLRDNEFEFNLLPLPANGDLRQCDVMILMLNPGLNPLDFEWEARPDFAQSTRNCILQTFASEEYPLFYLDPRFATSPGADYWYGDPNVATNNPKRRQRKLFQLTEAYAANQGISLDEARRMISQRVAILQLVPYHSRNFNAGRLINRLPSCLAARRLVQHTEEKRLIIVMRRIRDWGFIGPVETDNLVVYPPNLATSASLSPQSPGGRAILRRLNS